MSTNDKVSERRQYYRIDDSAVFTYQVVKNSTDNDLNKHKKPSAAFEMIELFSQMNQQMGVTLGRISEHSADVANYLKNLDNKIELLAHLYLFKDNESNLEPHRDINLGAGGLAFGSDEKLPQGTLLNMDMILSTDLLCLHLTGRVIQISKETKGNFPYRISVGFIDILDMEVDQISKHLMRLQAEQLRAQRGE